MRNFMDSSACTSAKAMLQQEECSKAQSRSECGDGIILAAARSCDPVRGQRTKQTIRLQNLQINLPTELYPEVS